MTLALRSEGSFLPKKINSLSCQVKFISSIHNSSLVKQICLCKISLDGLENLKKHKIICILGVFIHIKVINITLRY